MKLFSFPRPDELHQEISEELKFHIEMKTEELVGRGHSPSQARQIAEKSFGSTARIGEAGHDVRGSNRLEALVADVRFAIRLLRKRPLRTAVLVATLALGIGVNTAVFGVVHSLLLQPLAFRDADRLVVVRQSSHGAPSGVSYPHFQDWRTGSTSFENMAVYGATSATLTGHGDPIIVSGATISSSLFRVLRVQPIRGRLFQESEDRWPANAKVANPVVISDRLWRTRFGARQHIVGTLIQLDSHEYNVIGIMPSQFGFPIEKDPVDYWTNVAVDADPALYGGSIPTSRGYPRYDGVIARLKPGVSVARAAGEMANLARIIAKEHPHATSANEVVVVSALQAVIGGESQTMVLLLYGAVSCVLLVACVNVAAILLVDATARRREFSLRSALGAPASKLVRQLLVEAVVLAAAGCLVSSVVAALALHLFVAFAPPETPRLHEIRLDVSTLLYAPALSFAAGLLFGCLPAFSLRHYEVAGALKEGGWSVTSKAAGLRAGPVLICAQIALSMLLTCSAIMLVTSFNKILHSARGFNPHGLLTASVSLPIAGYGQTSPRIVGFYSSLLQNVRALPGVESATFTNVLPLSGQSNNTTVEVSGGHEPGMPGVDLRFVDADYFATLQIPRHGGRLFTNQDVAGRPACVIVNEAFVRRFLQGRDPYSSDLRLGWGGSRPKRIVGVVGDVRPTATSPESNPEVYVPFAQFPLNDMSILIRSAGNPETLLRPLRATVRHLDTTVPLDRVRTLENYLLLSSATQQFLMWLLVAFALMTTLLSAVGIYGVLSDATDSRAKEFGIRLALGSGRWRIVRLVLQQGVAVAVAGLFFGSCLTMASSKVLGRWLYDAGILNPSPFVVSAGVLFFIVLASSFVPSRRAAAINPALPLRIG